MKKAIVMIFPIIFIAGACDFLFGGLGGGDQGSGSRGIFLSTDSGQTWQESNLIEKDKSLDAAQISQVIFDPLDSKNILAVTYNSGVFASSSGGREWFPLLPGFAGYDAFLNPTNSHEIFAAGSRNQLAVILKSTDAGGTWTQIYIEPARQDAVTTLVYDPKNPSILYAGLASGTIIKSIDAGKTWNLVVSFPDRIVKLMLTPNGQTIYLLTRTQGIRRSEDMGKTWVSLAVREAPSQYEDLIFEPGNPGIIYLATDKGLLKSQDNGSNWVKLSLPVMPEVNQVSAAAVNPQNRRQIFASIKSTIYRSDDYGASWRPVQLATNRVINRIAIDPAEPNRIYVGLK